MLLRSDASRDEGSHALHPTSQARDVGHPDSYLRYKSQAMIWVWQQRHLLP